MMFVMQNCIFFVLYISKTDEIEKKKLKQNRKLNLQ